MAYTDPKEYRKFLKSKCEESENSECSECKEDSNCGCCPIGTLAVYDENGQHVGCLNAADFEENKINTHICADGYLKLFQGLKFIGCVPSADFSALYQTLNP